MLERVERAFPYSCEQIFDLASDIERYPEFVPLWISARVLRRCGDTVDVEQSLGLGPIRLTFLSSTVLHRPVRLDVLATGPPLGQYRLSMVFSACGTGGCLVRVEADVAVESPFLQHLHNWILPGFVDRVAEAFSWRAAALYGRPPAVPAQ